MEEFGSAVGKRIVFHEDPDVDALRPDSCVLVAGARNEAFVKLREVKLRFLGSVAFFPL